MNLLNILMFHRHFVLRSCERDTVCAHWFEVVEKDMTSG